MIKGIFATALTVLQVGVLYSCGDQGVIYDKAVFYTKSYYEDTEIGISISLEAENIVIDLPESKEISYPYTGLVTYKIINNHKYAIDYFYSYGDSSKEKITFPYTYTDSDVIESWSELDDYANSVIFIASWKKIY